MGYVIKVHCIKISLKSNLVILRSEIRKNAIFAKMTFTFGVTVPLKIKKSKIGLSECTDSVICKLRFFNCNALTLFHSAHFLFLVLARKTAKKNAIFALKPL